MWALFSNWASLYIYHISLSRKTLLIYTNNLYFKDDVFKVDVFFAIGNKLKRQDWDSSFYLFSKLLQFSLHYLISINDFVW